MNTCFERVGFLFERVIEKQAVTHYSSQDLIALSFNYFISHMFQLAGSSAKIFEPRVSVPMDSDSVHILECTVQVKYEYKLAYYLKETFGIDYDVMRRDRYGSCIIFYIDGVSWYELLTSLNYLVSNEWSLNADQLRDVRNCLWTDGSAKRSDLMFDLQSVPSLMRLVSSDGEIYELEFDDFLSVVKQVERLDYVFNKQGKYRYLCESEFLLFKKAYYDYIFNNDAEDNYLHFVIDYLN